MVSFILLEHLGLSPREYSDCTWASTVASPQTGANQRCFVNWVSLHCFPNYWNFGLERIKKKLSWRENLRELSRNGPDLIQYPDGEVSTSLVAWVLATIPDKTTWESFHHHVPFPTQQNYFQNDAFVEWKPLPPIRCCFLQTPREQVFFWIHNNIAFRGTGRGKNRYGYDV